jgi:hypothetical protein
MRIALAAILLLAQTAMTPFHAQIDHLVVAIRSLDEGVAAFEKMAGVKPVAGGQHPGRGTENALVSLGNGTYLEIIAPQKGATLGPQDRPMRDLAGLTVIAWAVSVADVQEARARLEKAGAVPSPTNPGSRVTPSGATLEWSTFGLLSPEVDVAPFFIHWGAATKHPSTTSPRGCTLSRLEIHDPAAASLSRALDALGVQHATVSSGPTAIIATLACPAGRVTLRTAE